MYKVITEPVQHILNIKINKIKGFGAGELWWRVISHAFVPCLGNVDQDEEEECQDPDCSHGQDHGKKHTYRNKDDQDIIKHGKYRGNHMNPYRASAYKP